ncbi:Hypothetical protein, putative [Bodo saltans]|uniref:Uncharacterized protein n=1 Tax=Bodo saltans TaxID=75058 RepID=A0A0S4KK87_BODSA|nr:Hypothetical protein, putative [Bodo saltans]|eukprot:CUI15014.1 Hypothetical protein, putative [Bodo saltans]
MFDKLKTIVGRSGAQQGSNMLQNAMMQKGGGGMIVPGGATGSSGMPASLQQFMNHAVQLGGKLFEEKEWQCPCGHKFKAGGEWVACAPIHCEAPRCPNPKYYVDGPGRALLEASPQGVRMQEVDHSKQLGSGQSSTSAGAPKNSMGRLGRK